MEKLRLVPGCVASWAATLVGDLRIVSEKFYEYVTCQLHACCRSVLLHVQLSVDHLLANNNQPT